MLYVSPVHAYTAREKEKFRYTYLVTCDSIQLVVLRIVLLVRVEFLGGNWAKVAKRENKYVRRDANVWVYAVAFGAVC